MRALQVSEERELAEAELPDPEPGAGEVVGRRRLLRHLRLGPAHAALARDRAAGAVMGHEFSGRVAALGEGVEGWEAGDRVCVLPGTPCGECPNCLAGHEHLCVRRRCAATGSAGARAPTPSASSSTPTAVPPARRGLRRARRAGRAAGRRRPRREPRRVGPRRARLRARGGADRGDDLRWRCAPRARADRGRRAGREPARADRGARLHGDAAGGGARGGRSPSSDGELPAAVFECAGHPSALGLALELVRARGHDRRRRGARGAGAAQPAAADPQGGA